MERLTERPNRTTIELDPRLMVALRARCARERRSFKAVLEIALESWLTANGDLGSPEPAAVEAPVGARASLIQKDAGGATADALR